MTQKVVIALAAICLIARPGTSKQNSPLGGNTAHSATISEFSWLQGRWTASLGSAQVEQYYSPVTGGVILGMFRLVAPQQAPLLEFSALRETPDGIELRLRHFDPELKPMEGSDLIVLRLSERIANRFVFENPVNSRPKRSILELKSATWLHTRAEIIGDSGSPSTIEVDWHRQSLELPGVTQAGTASPTKNNLETLAWFTGHWISPFGTGEVHEFWLAPSASVMSGILCPVSGGKAEGYEFSTLAPGADALIGRTWQVDADMKIPPGKRPIEAPLSAAQADVVEFEGKVGANSFTEKVERAGPGRMYKKLEILKPDGSPLQTIELHATRQPESGVSGAARN